MVNLVFPEQRKETTTTTNWQTLISETLIICTTLNSSISDFTFCRFDYLVCLFGLFVTFAGYLRLLAKIGKNTLTKSHCGCGMSCCFRMTSIVVVDITVTVVESEQKSFHFAIH